MHSFGFTHFISCHFISPISCHFHGISFFSHSFHFISFHLTSFISCRFVIFRSFIHSFIHLAFTHSFTHSLIHSLVYSFMLPFVSFHFTLFHFTSFRFISLHFILNHFISLQFRACLIAFHFISFRFISFRFISFHLFPTHQKKSYKQTGSYNRVLFSILLPQHVPGTTWYRLWRKVRPILGLGETKLPARACCKQIRANQRFDPITPQISLQCGGKKTMYPKTENENLAPKCCTHQNLSAVFFFLRSVIWYFCSEMIRLLCSEKIRSLWSKLSSVRSFSLPRQMAANYEKCLCP